MRTIIINRQRNPELFEVLQGAMKDGSRYEDCNVTRYYEYTTSGETFGMFTLREPDYEPPRFGV